MVTTALKIQGILMKKFMTCIIESLLVILFSFWQASYSKVKTHVSTEKLLKRKYVKKTESLYISSRVANQEGMWVVTYIGKS